MSQKRFLTADEVFQLFGVDADALDQLVESGDVKALKDLGTFKFRSEDFVNLVNQGKLSPRTSGEMFQVDAKGDIPFLKIKDDDHGIKFDDDVSFIELDEEALNEQASLNQTTPRTPVVPDQSINDTEGSADVDFKNDLKSDSDSDSNVRIIEDDDTIDFDEPDVPSHHSDSDVRLEGPVSLPVSPAAGVRKKPGSDSDVRLARQTKNKPDSDSDVTIAPPANPSTVAFRGPAGAAAKKSDSDVQLVSNVSSSEDEVVATIPINKQSKTDSDVVLVPADDVRSGAGDSTGEADSDSDVTIAKTNPELSISDIFGEQESSQSAIDESVENENLTDSSIRFESADAEIAGAAAGQREVPQAAAQDAGGGISFDDSDSGITLEIPASDFAKGGRVADEEMATDSEISIDPGSASLGVSDPDSGITLDTSGSDSDVILQSSVTQSELEIDDNGISLDASDPDSGITIDTTTSDSGISLESAVTDSEIATGDSGISLDGPSAGSSIVRKASATDSGIDVNSYAIDSGINLSVDNPESGVSLDSENSDSGIVLDSGDSGLAFESAMDSGLAFESAMDSTLAFESLDSGIRLGETDSGIALDGNDSILGATLHEMESFDYEPPVVDDNMTQTLDLRTVREAQDSAVEETFADPDNTLEMDLEDSDDELSETAATFVKAGPGKKALNLSDAFQTDESLEVEDLDISEELDGSPESDYSGEFAEADEEVLDASDEDFSEGEISVAEDAEESDSEEFAPVAKVRAVPKEPSWGILAVAPIVCASLMMAVTVTVLWGGISTMWTGGEAPGPAGMLISTLAGLM